MPFSMDPQLEEALKPLMEARKNRPANRDLQQRRSDLKALLEYINAQAPAPSDVTFVEFTAQSADGHHVPLSWFSKVGSSPGSALVYLHGGGMIAGEIPWFVPGVKRRVSATGVPMLAVDFRNAPEVQAPKMVEDAFAGLKYLHEHAKELGIDPARIGVIGDSGGGGIGAALTHLVKHLGGPPIAKAILIYPMLDDRNVHPNPHTAGLETWTANDSLFAWTSILGDRRGKDVQLWEVPGRMTEADAAGLPPHYIDIGQLDIFRDEDLEYVRNLSRAGVTCEFHLHPGAIHAWESLVPGADVSKRAAADRFRAIKSF